MSLSKFQDWIKSRGIALRCPACGSQRGFGVADELAMTSMLSGETGRIDYLRGFPLLLVTCNNCAFVMPFAAKQLGVVKAG